MTSRSVARVWRARTGWKAAICATVLLFSAGLGFRASTRWPVLILLAAGAFALVRQPPLGLLALIFSALAIPLRIGTGSDVTVNVATLLVPVLVVIWLLNRVPARNLSLARSRVNRPLVLFLVAGVVSLLVGNALWSPAVGRSSSFVIVQLAQWAIFAFSACAFWLTGNLVRDEVWLRRLTFFFLALATALGVLFVTWDRVYLIDQRIVTHALLRSPFWLVLTGLCAGQLLFNRGLSMPWRVVSLTGLGASLVYAFFVQQEGASNWVSLLALGSILAWLRWPRLRWLALVLLLLLTGTGILSSALYDFAGGEAEWEESGGSRLVLIERVVDVSLRNPVTGLGPAAYRMYAATTPLQYGHILWIDPKVASHNNFVDLFSHVGILGLGLFLWFAAEVMALGLRLRRRFTQGFAAGYINSMLGVWVGSLILMLFADWILPFVYNIGFLGFQASVLIWLFLGGLVALEQMPNDNR